MRKLVRDESGMTLALAVMMIVLIGVMGAGLLTFVSRDLESIVEVNQGQRAQEIADVGVDVAKRHLAVQDAMPSSYDSVVTAGNSSWYDDPPGGPDEPGPKVLTFDGNQVTVGIRYLTPTRPTDPSDQVRQPNNAPEVLPTYGSDTCDDTNGDGVDDPDLLSDVDACDYPNNRNYFRVTVRGGSGNALRQIQAIYVTQNFDFPVAYYATRDIDFNGNSATVSGMSLFANRYVLNVRPERITGADQAYGNWAVNPYTGAPNPYNAVPRTDLTGSSTTTAARAAGVAALGDASAASCTNSGPYRFTTGRSGITYDDSNENRQQKSRSAGAAQKYAYRDYDRDSDYGCTSSLALTPSGRPDFEVNTWGDRANQPPDTLTFPFATGDTAADDALLATLKEKAQQQGHYTRRAPGSTFKLDNNAGGGGDTPYYPGDSDLTDTVMFVEFASGSDDAPVYGTKGKVEYQAESSDVDNKVKGIIVVVNGDFDTSPSAHDPFQGAVIVRDPNDADNGTDNTSIDCNGTGAVMDFCNSGSFNIEGFVNVEGDMKLSGSVDGFLPAQLATGLPGLFKVSLWSWRECYNTTCS